MAGTTLKDGDVDIRLELKEMIFRHFDADGDGGLDRQEMAALVVALNPRIRFTKEQIDDVVDQVFRFYSKASRVTLDALLCIYDDIAGDVYRDIYFLFRDHLLHHTSASPEKGLQWEGTKQEEEEEEEEEEDSSVASLSFHSEDESSDFDDGGCAPPPLGLEETPSFRWLLSRSPSLQSGDGYAQEGDATHLSSTLDRLPSVGSSLTSSSFHSEVVFSELDDVGYAPQTECEEITSLRWLSSPSLAPQRGGGHGRVEGRNNKRRDTYSWAGIIRLGTFYGPRNLLRKN